ncbi:MAG: branched-chain amino acid ABC transporter ATP-binding protein/permease [Betaproteobacteria bacterium]|nr:branched-chain amino acid ABC transporter ATP-binding protein/permease [Betaproteobacteria bacterium]
MASVFNGASPAGAFNGRSAAAFITAGLILAMVPLLKLPAFYESFLYLVFHWIILATSWNILSGYSGYFSFGHGAFFGIGMYTTAVLSGKFDVPFLWTLPVAGALAALFGAGLGAVVFRLKRLRGELFAVLTLAVPFIIATIVVNTPIDGGQGVYLSAVPLPALTDSPSSTFYLLVLLLTIATLWMAREIQYSRLGTGLFAIHDDEDVAEVSGVPTYRYKVMVFSLSCALASAAGGIHALFVVYVTRPETFSILVPLYVVLMSVLGGTALWFGPAVGAVVVTVLLYTFTVGNYAIAGRALVGLILILVILFMPDGILGFIRKKWNVMRRARQTAKSQAAVERPAESQAAQRQGPIERLRQAVAPAAAPGGVLLELRAVNKSFAGVQALADVSLQVREGEILGLVGPNGSGKSTLINVVSGHYRVDGGEILFRGANLVSIKAHQVARSGIARTYQIPRPFARMSVLQNVALSAMFGHAGMDRANAEIEARHWLEFTGLGSRADALPADLNLHQRKFLELARALASRPSLVFLDEVLSGLTPSEIDDAVRLVRAIRDQGATVVFVEHVMRAVMQLTDRVVVLNHGRVIAEGLFEDAMRQPEVVRAYLGGEHV